MAKKMFTASLASVCLAVATIACGPAQAARPMLDGALASAGDAQLVLAQNRACFPGERAADCRARAQVEQRSNHHYVYRNGRYEDQTGAAVVGAILGFALGAAIAGSQQDHDYYYSHRNDRNWRSRCSSAYQGFDWHTGTYLGDDGYRHYCTR